MEVLKYNLDKSITYMKKRADGKRSGVIYHVGDLVLVKLKKYRQLSIAHHLSNKLEKDILVHLRSHTGWVRLLTSYN